MAWRQDRVKFWAAIARGLKTEDAAVEAGVSAPVAFRWFRHSGGMNPGLAPSVSGRHLSFHEREEIAIWRELRRNASTRTYRLDYKASIAQWHAERRA